MRAVSHYIPCETGYVGCMYGTAGCAAFLFAAGICVAAVILACTYAAAVCRRVVRLGPACCPVTCGGNLDSAIPSVKFRGVANRARPALTRTTAGAAVPAGNECLRRGVLSQRRLFE